MPLYRHKTSFRRLSAERLEAWSAIPPAIASDCMNRSQTMAAAVKPLDRGMVLCGQARTVTGMVGDNGAIHAALRLLEPDEVLVVDAGGFPDTAVFGGLLAQAAMARGAAGVVVYGAVRDCAEIIEFGLPVFASAIVPAGPHKGFGGTIDGPIACAGCPVSPGDIVLGDDDGVAVVPLVDEDSVLSASNAKIAQEEEQIRRLQAGESLADQMGLPDPEIL